MLPLIILSDLWRRSTTSEFQMNCLVFCLPFLMSLGSKTLGIFWNAPFYSPGDDLLMPPCIRVDTIGIYLNVAPWQISDIRGLARTGLVFYQMIWQVTLNQRDLCTFCLHFLINHFQTTWNFLECTLLFFQCCYRSQRHHTQTVDW